MGLSFFLSAFFAGLLVALAELDVFPDVPEEAADALADVDEDAAVDELVVEAAGAGSSFFGSPSPGFPGPMNVLTLSQNPTAIPLQETSFILCTQTSSSLETFTSSLPRKSFHPTSLLGPHSITQVPVP